MNGTELESFVANLERLLLPVGFATEVRHREYNADGVQLAEFDIIFTGRLGSAAVSWLIECRDRPSDGPAPGAWIEQLVGRRDRFQFDKVMAVSTTGFAVGAIEYAQMKGIELRNVKRLMAEDLLDWFQARQFDVIRRSPHLDDATIYISDTEPLRRQQAASVVVRQTLLSEPGLHNPITGEDVSAAEAFALALVRRPQLWPAEVHGEWSSDVQIDATYPVGYQYEIVMDEGAITVPRILFRGRLSVHVTSFPHVRLVEYADALNSSRIASSVSADFSVGQHELTVTFQRVTIGGVHNLAIRVEKAATVENES